MEKLRNSILVFGSIAALGLIGSCSKYSTISTKILQKIDATEQTNGPGSLQLNLSEEIAEDIAAALKAQMSLSEKEADTIKQGALQGIGRSTGLALQSNGDDLGLTAPLILQQAIAAMADGNANLGDDTRKISASSIMTEALFLSLGDKMDKVPAEQKEGLASTITKAGVGALDEGGLSEAAVSDGVGQLMGKAVANLIKAGYSKDEMKKIVGKVTKAGVEGLKDAGVSTKKADAALKSIMKNSVGAMGAAGVSKEELGSFVGPLMKEAVGGLKTLGFKPTQVGSVIDDMMSGAVGGMGTAGAKDSTSLKSVLGEAISGAMSGMGDAGVGSGQFADTLESLINGAVGSLKETGISSVNDIKDVSGDVVKKTVKLVDQFGIKDAEVIKKASLKVAKGTMSALSNLALSTADASSVAVAVQREGVAALKEQNDKYSFSSTGSSGLAALFSEGIREGLSKARFTQEAITNLAAPLAAAGKDGLIAASVDPATASQAESLAKTSITAWANEMQIHCEGERGIWHTDGGGWCEYPLLAPVAGAAGPSAAEEDRCFNDGGFVMYKPDGSWFCDVMGTMVVSGQADCAAKGYFWVPDPSGTFFCDPVAPLSTCYTHGTKTACQGAGCVWDATFCKAGTEVRCGDHWDSNSCSKSTGCVWNTTQLFCENATIVKCSANGTSSDCTKQSGCVWSNGACATAASISCVGQTTSSSCQATVGCSWDGSYCVNMQHLSCSDNTTQAACTSAQGCLWDGQDQFCKSAAQASCGSLTTQTSCGGEPGCLWSTANGCVNSATLDCASSTSSNTCGTTQGCLWNSTQSLCMNATQVDCQSQATQPTCSTTPGCVWDSQGSHCLISANVSCETYYTGATCSGAAGCTWDSQDNMCFNGTLVACGDFTTSSTCSNEPGCSWNGNICQVAALVDCSQNTSAGSCDNQGGCFWDSPSSSCHNSATMDCSQFNGSETSCNAENACAWNGDHCAPFLGSQCSTYTDQSTCTAHSMDGCDWNYNQSMCEPAGYSCNDYQNNLDCETDPVCNWDNHNGGSCHTDGVAACAQGSDQTSCDFDPFCSWNTGTSVCEYSGPPDCHSMDSSQCSSNSPECYWDSFDSACRNNWTTQCSYFDADQATCENEPYCNWTGSACDYAAAAPDFCPAHTSESACTTSGECNWDSYGQRCYVKDDAWCDGLTENHCHSDNHSYCQWNSGTTSCDYIGPVNCHSQSTQTECTTAATYCSWDSGGSGHCRQDNFGYCSQAIFNNSQTLCEGDWELCQYDPNGSPQCYYAGPIDCYGNDVTTCNQKSECYVDPRNQECRTSYPNYCSMIFKEENCNQRFGCAYNTSNSSCEATSGPQTCHVYNDSTSCNNDPVCAYSNSYNFCFADQAAVCSSQVDSQSCSENSHYGCQWETSSCVFNDHYDPMITNLTVSPTATAAGNSISFTITAQDESGIQLSNPSSDCWEIRSDHSPQKLLYACNTLTDNGDGTFTKQFLIPPGAEAGNYFVKSLKLIDNSANANYSYLYKKEPADTQYEGTSINIAVFSVTNGSPDTVAPQLASAVTMTPNSGIDTSSGPIAISISFTTNEAILPVLSQPMEFQSAGPHTFWGWPIDFTDHGSNNYTITVEFSQYMQTTTYKLRGFEIYDSNGNPNHIYDSGGNDCYDFDDGCGNYGTVPTAVITNSTPDIDRPNVVTVGDTTSSPPYILGISLDGTQTAPLEFDCFSFVNQADSNDTFSFCGQPVSGTDNGPYNFEYSPPPTPGATYILIDFKVRDAAGNKTRYFLNAIGDAYYTEEATDGSTSAGSLPKKSITYP